MRADADESYLRIIHQPALSMIAITAVFGPPSRFVVTTGAAPAEVFGKGRFHQWFSLTLFSAISVARGFSVFLLFGSAESVFISTQKSSIYQYRIGFTANAPK
jgi:hypothetical protein